MASALPDEDDIKRALKEVTYQAERWESARLTRDADQLRIVASAYRKAEDEFTDWILSHLHRAPLR